MTDLKVERF